MVAGSIAATTTPEVAENPAVKGKKKFIAATPIPEVVEAPPVPAAKGKKNQPPAAKGK